MSLQPSKSDQDFRKILIANQDILLSPNMEQQNDSALDIFSFINTESMLNLIDQVSDVSSSSSSSGSSNTVYQSNSNQPIDILDANLFEILKADDPEIVSLLESIDKTDLQINFLPQISVNTASKLLDEQPELEPVTKIEPLSQYQTIQLKTELTDDLITNFPAPRTSQRLSNKKEKIKGETDSKLRNTTNQISNNKISKIKSETTTRLNLKRKRSVDDDDDSNYNMSENDSVDFNSSQSSSKYLVSKQNENSIDFESDDHIYYDDDDDDQASLNENIYYDEDDDQEKEFKNYVRNYSITSRNRNKKLDPTKKESNKEAATRYRLKKLSEKERLFETRMNLENENSEVKRKIEITQTEINYLKNLLVQMLLTKGVLGSKI